MAPSSGLNMACVAGRIHSVVLIVSLTLHHTKVNPLEITKGHLTLLLQQSIAKTVVEFLFFLLNLGHVLQCIASWVLYS